MPIIQEETQKFHVPLLLHNRGNLSSAIIEVIDQIVSRFLQEAPCPLSGEQSENGLEASSSILSVVVRFDLNHFHNRDTLSNADRIDPVASRSLMEGGPSALVQEAEDADRKLDSEENSSMENLLPFPLFIEEYLSPEERKICDDIYKNR